MRGAPASWKTCGLAGLRDRQAAGAELELAQADLGRLVRLRVRPERDPVLVRVRLQILQVGLEAIEIDDRDGRLDLAQRAAHLRGEQLERAIGSGAHRGRSIENRASRRGKLGGVGLENPIHLLVLAVIILLVFGSSQLPKIARSAGKHAREAKDGVAIVQGRVRQRPWATTTRSREVTDTIRSANPKTIVKDTVSKAASPAKKKPPTLRRARLRRLPSRGSRPAARRPSRRRCAASRR